VFSHAAISCSFGIDESVARGRPANTWQMCLWPSGVKLLGEEAVVKESGRGEGAGEDSRGLSS